MHIYPFALLELITERGKIGMYVAGQIYRSKLEFV